MSEIVTWIPGARTAKQGTQPGSGECRPSTIRCCSARLLGSPWDLVTTYSWGYNPTYNWGNPLKSI